MSDTTSNMTSDPLNDPLGAWACSDSLRTPSIPDPSRVRNESPIISLADLGPSQEPDWVWPGYLARGAITLFTGLWKAGKTTLLGHLLRDLERGSGLAPHRMEAPSLVCSEEPPGIWARRRDELRLPPSVFLLRRDSFRRPTFGEWPSLIEMIVGQVEEHEIGLVVFDTLPSLWPVLNENDAGETLHALAPMRAITDAGAALLLVHHPRKGGGTQGEATRGSGSLPGFVDIILELRRYRPEDANDTRRTLTAMGRFEKIPAQRVIELGDDGYTIIGDRDAARDADLRSTIAPLLPADGEGLTYDGVRALWPTKPGPGQTALRQTLNAGADEGLWSRSGTGRKNDPYRFKGKGDGNAEAGG